MGSLPSNAGDQSPHEKDDDSPTTDNDGILADAVVDPVHSRESTEVVMEHNPSDHDETRQDDSFF